MTKFYIADTHFRHGNILRFDKRPWVSLEDMEQAMVSRWNKRVNNNDDVYILGDFCWSGNADVWAGILSQLNGRKYLITGNHDLKQFPQKVTAYLMQKPVPYKEIDDDGRTVILSHYPLLCYKHDSDPYSYMLYGHVHGTVEYDATQDAVRVYRKSCEAVGYKYQGKLYNCWCGLYDWAPATLDEIIKKSDLY